MSLYLEHFGLREPPFRITPDTDYFFTGANRGPTLEALIYAITQDEGIVKVSGEVGSGKTMLCRMLLERLPDNVETLYLANPSLSREEIVGAIADELGVGAQGKATHSLMRALQDALIERYAQGKRVVLLIDEAHAMPAESLEEIRLLSNLESKAAKLLQIALFAQPELDERLAATDMRQLRERITQHFILAPLKTEDIGAYIDFRLRTAGYHGPTPFTPKALLRIGAISQGLSRRINILADKALLAAFSTGIYQVDLEQIRIAEKDAHFSPLRPKEPSIARQTLIGGALGALLVALLGGIALTLTAKAPQPPGLNEPAVPQMTLGSGEKKTAATPSADSTGKPVFGPLTRQHMAQFDTWIDSAPRTHYFIQLHATDATRTGEIEGVVAQAATALDPAQLRVYRASRAGRDRVGVIYGDYPNRESAAAAMQTLPESTRAIQAFPRQVSKLR